MHPLQSSVGRIGSSTSGLWSMSSDCSCGNGCSIGGLCGSSGLLSVPDIFDWRLPTPSFACWHSLDCVTCDDVLSGTNESFLTPSDHAKPYAWLPLFFSHVWCSRGSEHLQVHLRDRCRVVHIPLHQLLEVQRHTHRAVWVFLLPEIKASVEHLLTCYSETRWFPNAPGVHPARPSWLNVLLQQLQRATATRSTT